MPEVIQLIDRKNETIFSPRDFVELVDKYMGYESAKYVQTVLDEKEELEEYMEGLEDDGE